MTLPIIALVYHLHVRKWTWQTQCEKV